ncbi:HU family DNA-binding protein [Paracoccaceae bacterium Fryx2]|nr:HU family DNA-binding protein [Paracoccaceae bacterium Fryx2]
MPALDLSTLSIAELRVLAGDLARAIATKLGPQTRKETTMTRLNKTDVIATIAALRGIAQSDVRMILDDVLNLITKAADVGDTVTLKAFGVFAPRTRKARIARNPATGAEVAVAEKTVLTFKPAKAVTAAGV